MRWLKRGHDAFFQSPACMMTVTAIGLVGAIICAAFTRTQIFAIVICVIIALVGAWSVAYQMRLGYRKAKQEEEEFESARGQFNALREDWKQALKDLWIRKSIARSEVRNDLDFNGCGFVFLDSSAGRFYLSPYFIRFMPQLIKEWESGKAFKP